MLKQRIGTSISMNNSGLMLYPSLTFCQQPGNGNNYTILDTLTHTPDLTNVVAWLQAYDRPSNKVMTITPENRERWEYLFYKITVNKII